MQEREKNQSLMNSTNFALRSKVNKISSEINQLKRDLNKCIALSNYKDSLLKSKENSIKILSSEKSVLERDLNKCIASSNSKDSLLISKENSLRKLSREKSVILNDLTNLRKQVGKRNIDEECFTNGQKSTNDDKINKKIVQGINYVFKKTYSRLSHKEKGSRLLTLLHNGDLCGDEGIHACKDYVKCISRKQFCAWRLCKTCDTAYNVLELSTMKSIEMAATSDGAKLTARFNHLTSFFKQIDPDLQDPSSKQFLFKDSSGMMTYKNVQSRTLCILAQSVTCNETKQSVKDVLGDFYSWMLKVMKDGLPYRDNQNPAIKPILF